MSGYILQVNYKREGTPGTVPTKFRAVAEAIAAVPGLRWKIWLYNELSGEGGGIYLFSDLAALKAFVDGPIINGLKSDPAFTGLSIKTFGMLEELSRITNAPV